MRCPNCEGPNGTHYRIQGVDDGGFTYTTCPLNNPLAALRAENERLRRLVADFELWQQCAAYVALNAPTEEARIKAQTAFEVLDQLRAALAKPGGGIQIVSAGIEPGGCQHEDMPFDRKRNENVCTKCGFGR